MEIKIPEVGESIHEALVAQWLKEDGDPVSKGETICELETDKINVEIEAEATGTLSIKTPAGETVAIGTVIGSIAEGDGSPVEKQEDSPAEQKEEQTATQTEADQKESADKEQSSEGQPAEKVMANPAAKQLAREQGISLDQVKGSGRQGRITREDVQRAVEQGQKDSEQEHKTSKADVDAVAKPDQTVGPADVSGRPVTREAMTPIRQRIAARLLEARQQTAMLTTFNEADMTQVKTLRARHQENFTKKHGIKLGLMSFFVKATVEALREFPAVNASIDGQDIVYHHFYDIGIAVGTDRGLVVPVLRNADQLTFAEIEKNIAELGKKAQERKLSLAEIEGGTFTISNGGIYGSLLSTPILNPPQTGVLGMHAIQDRPVVRNEEIVIRPIMNLALSYDHRLIDGREAVSFLKLIKEYIEDPEELLLEL